ncbi:MAG: ABC transporter ATP-binding protein [Alphaproteobacteria bacterium]|nr:ABC transporter ATP-binding protein [Alphaproteobacteria bacterium]
MSAQLKLAEPKITMRSVTKRYESARGESVEALAGIDLDVAAGEFLTLVGPSGCGKSTLLNIVAGFEQASGGEVVMDGRPIAEPGPERGVVFQEYALFPWLSVAGNIGFGPASRGLGDAEVSRRVERCVAMVKLDGFEHKYPHELSGGMRQRCALARCIANDPDVMLMDEPLAALDALTRLGLQDELLRIWSEASRERARTVLYITHAIDEALYLSDRILVMSHRPARIRREIRVPFSRPRDPEVRTHETFHRLSDEIWQLLRREI